MGEFVLPAVYQMAQSCRLKDNEVDSFSNEKPCNNSKVRIWTEHRLYKDSRAEPTMGCVSETRSRR